MVRLSRLGTLKRSAVAWQMQSLAGPTEAWASARLPNHRSANPAQVAARRPWRGAGGESVMVYSEMRI
ncbi:MAG: hypothetical protein EA400_06990 [Chromatiaceae bacterium]|nr:MAG: hypothetical protein EA400_06990 [Chromatiaceae bacterium]